MEGTVHGKILALTSQGYQPWYNYPLKGSLRSDYTVHRQAKYEPVNVKFGARYAHDIFSGGFEYPSRNNANGHYKREENRRSVNKGVRKQELYVGIPGTMVRGLAI